MNPSVIKCKKNAHKIRIFKVTCTKNPASEETSALNNSEPSLSRNKKNEKKSNFYLV